MSNPQLKISASKHVPSTDRIIFSHRGLNLQAPENTMPAFELAAKAGVSWIETDIDVLPDGTAIIIHDSTLDRTTNGSGSIYDLRQADLAQVDAGAWFSPKYAGTRLPLLSELIAFMNHHKVNANLELKAHETGKEGAKKLVETFLTELENLDSDREIIVSSFSHLQLALVNKMAPELAIGALWTKDTLSYDWLSVLELTGASYAHLEDEGVTEQHVRTLRAAGYGVNVWTVNAADRANQLFNWGATGIFTDVADQFV